MVGSGLQNVCLSRTLYSLRLHSVHVTHTKGLYLSYFLYRHMQGWLQTKYIATLDLYLGIKSKFLLNIETTDSRLCTDLMKGLMISPIYTRKRVLFLFLDFQLVRYNWMCNHGYIIFVEKSSWILEVSFLIMVFEWKILKASLA